MTYWKETRVIKSTRATRGTERIPTGSCVVRIREVSKGARWMPWLPEAKKDVTSCEKPG